jgi:hypothetical protein
MDRQELVARMVVGVKIVRTSMEENKVCYVLYLEISESELEKQCRWYFLLAVNLLLHITISLLLIYAGAKVSEEKDNQVESGEKENEEQMHDLLDCSDECINDGFQLQNAEMSPITPFEYKR